MLSKPKNPPSFAEACIVSADKRWKEHWLHRVQKIVNWKSFASELEKLYNPKEGRQAWEPVMLFRCLLLAEWNGLSDRGLEEALEFRIDFKKFAGLEVDAPVPDATTFVVFRDRIQPIRTRLFERLDRQLREAGFEVHRAIAVDATLVEAHCMPTKNDDEEGGSSGGDPDSSWRGFPVKNQVNEDGNEVISRRMAFYGYKVNFAASIGTGFVSGVSVCKASEHETHHLKELVRPGTRRVYADKGYVGNQQYLRDEAIIDGIKADQGERYSGTFTDAARARAQREYRQDAADRGGCIRELEAVVSMEEDTVHGAGEGPPWGADDGDGMEHEEMGDDRAQGMKGGGNQGAVARGRGLENEKVAQISRESS